MFLPTKAESEAPTNCLSIIYITTGSSRENTSVCNGRLFHRVSSVYSIDLSFERHKNQRPSPLHHDAKTPRNTVSSYLRLHRNVREYVFGIVANNGTLQKYWFCRRRALNDKIERSHELLTGTKICSIFLFNALKTNYRDVRVITFGMITVIRERTATTGGRKLSSSSVDRNNNWTMAANDNIILRTNTSVLIVTLVHGTTKMYGEVTSTNVHEANVP